MRARHAGLLALAVVLGCSLGCKGDEGGDRRSGQAGAQADAAGGPTADDASANPSLGLVRVAAASGQGPSQAPLRLQLSRGSLDLDSLGWQRQIAGDGERARLVREEKVEVDLGVRNISLESRNHLLPALFEALSDARDRVMTLDMFVGHDAPPVLAVEIEAEVEMGQVVEVLLTANRSGFEAFELVVATTSGPGWVPLQLPELEAEEPVCRELTLLATREGIYLSTMWSPGRLAMDQIYNMGAGVRPSSVTRQYLAGPDQQCAVAVEDGDFDLAGLDLRLAELPKDGCPRTRVLFEGDVTWSMAAPLLAHLDSRGARPLLTF
ncbi:MAG: hypothetical protein KC457_19755, partial [Myxococcales bacterium]|nr:hypothetical protein [Myxococcales bacterium]